MQFGECSRAPAKLGPSQASGHAMVANTSGHPAWRALDGEQRLAMIDRALRPANDLIDRYPLAL